MPKVLSSTLNVMGTSSMLFTMSSSSFEGTAMSVMPSMWPVSTSTFETKVVSKSVARMVSIPSSRWKGKQLMIGTVLLLVSTPLNDWICFENSRLLMMNFISLSLFIIVLLQIAKI